MAWAIFKDGEGLADYTFTKKHLSTPADDRTVPNEDICETVQTVSACYWAAFLVVAVLGELFLLFFGPLNQARLTLERLLPQPPERWVDRLVPSRPNCSGIPDEPMMGVGGCPQMLPHTTIRFPHVTNRKPRPPLPTAGTGAIKDMANVDKILTPAVSHLSGIKLCNCLESMAVFKVSVIHPLYSNPVIPHAEKKEIEFSKNYPLSWIIYIKISILNNNNKRQTHSLLPSAQSEDHLKSTHCKGPHLLFTPRDFPPSTLAAPYWVSRN